VVTWTHLRFEGESKAKGIGVHGVRGRGTSGGITSLPPLQIEMYIHIM